MIESDLFIICSLHGNSDVQYEKSALHALREFGLFQFLFCSVLIYPAFCEKSQKSSAIMYSYFIFKVLFKKS